MPNQTRIVFVSVLITALLLIPSCKKTAEPEFILTVQLSAGASGTPRAGTYSYPQNQDISYDYSASTGYKNLQVTLDGQGISASGLVSMTGDRLLSASAERILYMQGNWSINAVFDPNTCDIESSNGILCEGTQSGDDISLLSHAPDGDLLMTGKIDLAGNITLEGTADYGGGYTRTFNCTGAMNGENEFSLTIVVRSYMNGALFCTVNGTCTAQKI